MVRSDILDIKRESRGGDRALQRRAKIGQMRKGLTALHEAQEAANRSGECWREAERHRLQGARVLLEDLTADGEQEIRRSRSASSNADNTGVLSFGRIRFLRNRHGAGAGTPFPPQPWPYREHRCAHHDAHDPELNTGREQK